MEDEFDSIEKVNNKSYFLSLPAQIRQQQERALVFLKEYKEVAKKAKDMYESQYLEVLKQIDENGKKLYSNDTLRKDATMSKLEATNEWATLKEREEFLEIEMKKLDIEVGYLIRMFEAIKYLGLAKGD